MTIAHPDPALPALPALPAVDSWVPVLAQVGDLAQRIAKTEFVPKAMQGKPEAVAAAILLGRELGLPPMRALSEIHVIQGKPALSAAVMRALVLAQGHTIHVQKWSEEECVLVGWRRGEEHPAATVRWTVGDAQRAGLTAKNPTWKTYPKNMLLARATSDLCRAAFPDVIAGLQAMEDLDTGEPAQQRVTVRRKPAQDAPSGPPEPSQSARKPAPLPEAPPEDANPAEPPQEDVALITPKQSRMLHARLRELGWTDRTHALQMISELIGRDLESTKQLSRTEASTVIDTAPTAPQPEPS